MPTTKKKPVSKKPAVKTKAMSRKQIVQPAENNVATALVVGFTFLSLVFLAVAYYKFG